MNSNKPPDFAAIADGDARKAFLGRGPECVEWLAPGTKLYKWSNSILGRRGVSPWWLFLESRLLSNGVRFDGLKERQERARRLGANDRDYHRIRSAVTKQWNPMTLPLAIRLVTGAWGYVGKCSGQRFDNEDKDMVNIFLIGGDYQIWIPGLIASNVSQISILPYLTPGTGQ